MATSQLIIRKISDIPKELNNELTYNNLTLDYTSTYLAVASTTHTYKLSIFNFISYWFSKINFKKTKYIDIEEENNEYNVTLKIWPGDMSYNSNGLVDKHSLLTYMGYYTEDIQSLINTNIGDINLSELNLTDNQKNEIYQLLGSYITREELNNSLSSYIQNDTLSSILSSYIDKENLDNILSSYITSTQLNNIGLNNTQKLEVQNLIKTNSGEIIAGDIITTNSSYYITDIIDENTGEKSLILSYISNNPIIDPTTYNELVRKEDLLYIINDGTLKWGKL